MALEMNSPFNVDDESVQQDLIARRSLAEPEVMPRVFAYGSMEAVDNGLVPFDSYASTLDHRDVSNMTDAELKDFLNVCNKEKRFPKYHQETMEVLKTWNQGNLGYCWAFSATACVMGVRQVEGQSYVELAPESLGWLVGWRNRGFFMDQTLIGIRERGIAPRAMVPRLSIDPNQFADGWQSEALKYRVVEWWDFPVNAAAGTIIRKAALLLSAGRPGYAGYNWWGHAVEVVGLVWDETKPYNVIWEIQNSHRDGVIQLVGERAIPSELYFPRAAIWK